MQMRITNAVAGMQLLSSLCILRKNMNKNTIEKKIQILLNIQIQNKVANARDTHYYYCIYLT